MKIAIPSLGQSIDSLLDHRCVRGYNFIVYNSETKNWFHIDVGQQFTDTHTIGFKIAKMFSRLKVDALISGHCRPEVMDILRYHDIIVYQGADGRIREILNEVETGKLKYLKKSM